jgi:hypothetical protein
MFNPMFDAEVPFFMINRSNLSRLTHSIRQLFPPFSDSVQPPTSTTKVL